ncbi:MAG: WYL domain-containing protein, partial [Desulfuromonadales bacterium]|nr:WYL domain-containing protein [Desulfuromonadales bacterium]
VTVLDERFDIPDDFSSDDLTGSAFGLVDEKEQTIKVRFGPEVAHLIRERLWHPTQTIEEDEGGAVTLSFTAGGEQEILAWLYSYLPHVQLLAPQALKQKFYAGLDQSLQQR